MKLKQILKSRGGWVGVIIGIIGALFSHEASFGSKGAYNVTASY